MTLPEINWLAVLCAGLAAWVLGALWYSPVLFGKAWQKELGITDFKPTPGMIAKTFGGSFVLMTVMAFGLAVTLPSIIGPEINGMSGLKGGLLHGILFVATSIGINYLYQMRSMKLFLIDACYQILFLGLAGLIVGAWRP